MTTVAVRKLPTQVAVHLGRELIALAGEPGAVLPSEQEICTRYGVSRTVAREAMQLLAGLDLVRISSGRRMELRPPQEWNYLHPLLLDMLDPVEVRHLLVELHEVRLMIEPVVAARAACVIGPDQLHRLEATLEAMRALESEPDRYLERDLEFHAQICAVIGNRVLDRILHACRWLLMASRRVTNRLWDSLASVTDEHRAIYRALAAHDPQAAEAAMRAHLAGNARAWSLPPELIAAVLEPAAQAVRERVASGVNTPMRKGGSDEVIEVDR